MQMPIFSTQRTKNLLCCVQKSVHSPQQYALQKLSKQLRLDVGLRQSGLVERLTVQKTLLAGGFAFEHESRSNQPMLNQ